MSNYPTRDEPTLVFPPLSVLQVHLFYKLLEDTTLPSYKGALFRGGFGYALQHMWCEQSCWGHSRYCQQAALCPYRSIFEPQRPQSVSHLHDLQDIPRFFVIRPPLDSNRFYHAGNVLDFGLILIGRGIDSIQYFLSGFKHLGENGLGRSTAKVLLERAEAIIPFGAERILLYEDGWPSSSAKPSLSNLLDFTSRAATIPSDFTLELRTPLRLKSKGNLMEKFDLTAVVQSVCWRINALATFYGDHPWQTDYQSLITIARDVKIGRTNVRWVDWERTSTREGGSRKMKLGGLIGSIALHDVPISIRAILLAGSILHVGKACVFGHGWLVLK